jgi:hypothetical protein
MDDSDQLGGLLGDGDGSRDSPSRWGGWSAAAKLKAEAEAKEVDAAAAAEFAAAAAAASTQLPCLSLPTGPGLVSLFHRYASMFQQLAVKHHRAELATSVVDGEGVVHDNSSLESEDEDETNSSQNLGPFPPGSEASAFAHRFLVWKLVNALWGREHNPALEPAQYLDLDTYGKCAQTTNSLCEILPLFITFAIL